MDRRCGLMEQKSWSVRGAPAAKDCKDSLNTILLQKVLQNPDISLWWASMFWRCERWELQEMHTCSV